MKIIKYVLSSLFLLGGVGFISQGNTLSGLISILFGAILLPQISENLKSKFQFWQNKGLRYIIYIGFFILSGIFMKRQNLSNSLEKINKNEAVEDFVQPEKKEKAILSNGNDKKVIDKEKQYNDEVEKQFQNDDSDFWSEYDPIVKRRIYDLIKNKDCAGLQKEFKITADNLDRIQNTGGSGSRNLQLMDFLNVKMEEFGCYKK